MARDGTSTTWKVTSIAFSCEMEAPLGTALRVDSTAT
jgi:hypothetical protein